MTGDNYVAVVRKLNDCLDALIALEDWIAANQRIESCAYKGDARKEADKMRTIYLDKLSKVEPLITQRRANA